MARCDDGLRNGAETDVDCGGSCSPCPTGDTCLQGSDCLSMECLNNICIVLDQAPQTDLSPGDLTSPSDLGSPPDLTSSTDLTPLPDLAVLFDLASPPDLTSFPDLASPPDLSSPPDLGPSYVDPTFAPAETIVMPTQQQALQLVVADFDGNGTNDILVLQGPYGGDTSGVAVLPGNGDGTFGAATSFPLQFGGINTYFNGGLLAADLNADHFSDFAYVVQNSESENISALVVALNQGGQGFAYTTLDVCTTMSGQWSCEEGGTSNPYGLQIGDLDSNGSLDVLEIVNSGGGYSPDYAYSYLNDGTGTFTRSSPMSLIVAPYTDGYSSLLFDVDGDHVLDLLVPSGYQILKYLGHGDGTFASGEVQQLGKNGFYQGWVGDLDGDGVSDILALSNLVLELLGEGNGTFSVGPTVSMPDSPNSCALGDFNSDGKSDIACAMQFAITVVASTSTGPAPYSLNFSTLSDPGSLVVADVNADGLLDLVFVAGGNVQVLLNTTR